MRKMSLTLIAAASIAAATFTFPTQADARCHGCWVGAGIAAGVLGAATIANAGYYYPPAYYGGYYPAYYGGYGYAPRYYGYYAPRYYAPRYYPRYGYGYYRPYRYW